MRRVARWSLEGLAAGKGHFAAALQHRETDPTHDQVILELLGGEALVRDDQQSGPVGDQVFMDVEHGLEHFAFVGFRVRQRPQDRSRAHGS
ncbi:hypothetical protein AB0L99_45870 [Streptomyces sp. NPDC051954]|uniref:hypothetical protein n=1 Tax=unclassified Streptomyces TaxID=2593676 RepID=UPI003437125C